MSDDFIPLNQSTPVQNQKRWVGQNFQQSGQLGSWRHNQKRTNYNNKRCNNFGNDSNSSQVKDRGIDAYLHPSMLQNPWAYLQRKNAENETV